MDSKPEDFEKLRRLLTLKGHEQPPPGYFDSFSREVIVRLETGEAAQKSAAGDLAWEAPWLQRLLEMLSGKPMWSGAVGVGACALMIAGVLYAERMDFKPITEQEIAQSVPSLPVGRASIVFNQPLVSSEATSLTNTSVQPTIPSGLFGGQIQGQPQNTGWLPRR